jgi:hypothetical protein
MGRVDFSLLYHDQAFLRAAMHFHTPGLLRTEIPPGCRFLFDSNTGAL